MDDRCLAIFKTSWEDLEQLAEELIDEGFFPELKEGEPVDILRFFECDLPDYMNDRFGISGFKTGVRDLDSIRIGLEGYTHAPSKSSYLHKNLYDDPSINAQRRMRSTAGHEALHCIGHIPAVSDFISVHGQSSSEEYYRKKKDIPAYMNPDIQADIFSGCVLMPRQELQLLHRQGKLSESYLTERFNVHPAFVRSRLRRDTIFNEKPRCSGRYKRG